MALTTIGGLLAAAAATYGTVRSSANASAANKQAGATAAAGLQDSQNQQNYTKALNALALQRSTAGTIDSRGSTGTYDPSTNTWRTQLSPQAAAIQQQGDDFTKQNLKDVTQGNAQTLTNNASSQADAREANSAALAAAATARGSADSARMQLENFRPQTTAGLEGDLQQVATTANRQAQQPIIADTLRSMARTGTAAAPVLTAMQRDNATSLRQTMLQDHITALEKGAEINNANRSGLESTYSALNGAATPKLQTGATGGLGSAATTDPSAAINSEIATRAASAGTIGAQAGNVSNQGAAVGNQARSLAAGYTPMDNTGGLVSSLGSNIAELIKKGQGAYNFFGGGAGNAGDVYNDPTSRATNDGGFTSSRW